MASVRLRKMLRWARWVLLTLLLLPFVSLMLMKATGTMKLRKSDDQIMGELHAYPIHKKIDSVQIGQRHIVFLMTSKEERKKKDAFLFVHGSPGSLDAFMFYMHNEDLLAAGDLITYDRPGFGHSDYGRALSSLRGQASILYALMQHLDYDRYWLVGHSYGGAVLIQAAIDRPRGIGGIAIIAGSIIYDLEPVAAWRKWIDLPFVRILLPTSFRVSNDELMALRSDLRMIDDDWDDITIPVTIIHGTRDVLVPFDNLVMAKEKLVNVDSVRTQVFEEENHFILWTQRSQIVKEILALKDSVKK